MVTIRVLRHIAVHDPANDTYYFVEPSFYQARKYNNYALVSQGWTVDDDLPRRAFQRMKKQEISRETWQHSGCQSRCILRGANTCQW